MRIQPVDGSSYRELAAATIAGDLPFGRVFTPHMVTIEFDRASGWHDAKVVQRSNLSLDPASMCLHYGQTAFEGLKAHRRDDGSVVLFRVADHAARMQRTCERLCIPQLPVEDFISATEALVTTDYAWVPEREGTSLYLRPTVIATEAALGVRPADQYLFFFLATSTGPYFATGFRAIRVAVEQKMTRAAPGGLGSAKAGANYVASMLAAERSKEAQCAQVLWLDAVEHKWVEETGASNVFWVERGAIVTSPLGDTVLGGLTRDSVLRLAPRIGYRVEERRISLTDLVAAIRAGVVTEIFGSGTAAVVAPIGELLVDHDIVRVADGTPGPVATKLLEAITALQHGRAADPFGWLTPVPAPSWA